MNLEDRLREAIKAIETLLSQNSEMYRRSDTEILRGKIEGINLALFYLKEEQRKFVPSSTFRHASQDWLDNVGWGPKNKE